jgi:hypothetical protein
MRIDFQAVPTSATNAAKRCNGYDSGHVLGGTAQHATGSSGTSRAGARSSIGACKAPERSCNSRFLVGLGRFELPTS